MRKILVFQHVATEPLGHLDPLLRQSGVRIRYVNFGREPHAEPDVRRYDGLVVLGGPMNVDQAHELPHLRTEMAAIREVVQAGKPMLGICLGAQLLAELDAYAEALAALRALVAAGDAEGLEQVFAAARTARNRWLEGAR